MTGEKQLDLLIDAGWKALYNGIDRAGFRNWQIEALGCLTGLLGADHSYTRSFKSRVQDPDELSVLIGGGILAAAKQELQRKPDI